MTTTKQKDINKEVKNKQVDVIEKDVINPNDMFSAENMAKMYSMFKQMELMNNQQNVQEEKTVVNNKKIITSTKFTKSMLAKISDEEVTTRSTVDNLVFTSPRTKIEYNWLNKGDVETITVGELLAMENKSKRFLHTPWLIIEDKRVIEALGLERTYNLIKKVENIDELITLNKDEIEKIFNELPREYQNNFRNEIYKKVKTRELNNLNTIDDLGQILHIDLKNI